MARAACGRAATLCWRPHLASAGLRACEAAMAVEVTEGEYEEELLTRDEREQV